MERDKLLKKIEKILLKKAEGFFYTEEVCEYQNNEQTIKQLDLFETNNKNIVTKQSKNERNKKEFNLILSKKKITTHYIPPDMLAIKMLVENFGQTIDDTQSTLSNMSDEELISLQNKLINELNKNIKED